MDYTLVLGRANETKNFIAFNDRDEALRPEMIALGLTGSVYLPKTEEAKVVYVTVSTDKPTGFKPSKALKAAIADLG